MRVGVILGGLLFGTAEALAGLPHLAARRRRTPGSTSSRCRPRGSRLRVPTVPVRGVSRRAGLPYPEPLTTLAAVWRSTAGSRSISTLIVPLRPAPLLAKACATVESSPAAARARAGAVGGTRTSSTPPACRSPGRGDRIDDTLRACKALWRDAPASISSPTVSFERPPLRAAPRAAGGIPVWVGGSSIARTARRVADYADGWIPPPSLTREEIAEGVARIRASAGRELEVGLLRSRSSTATSSARSLACLPCARRA